MRKETEVTEKEMQEMQEMQKVAPTFDYDQMAASFLKNLHTHFRDNNNNNNIGLTH